MFEITKLDFSQFEITKFVTTKFHMTKFTLQSLKLQCFKTKTSIFIKVQIFKFFFYNGQWGQRDNKISNFVI